MFAVEIDPKNISQDDSVLFEFWRLSICSELLFVKTIFFKTNQNKLHTNAIAYVNKTSNQIARRAY